MTSPLPRLASVIVGSVLLLLLAAGAAHAEDDLALDERLSSAGFENAYSYVTPSDQSGGVRVLVEYSSDSDDQQAHEAEAERVAEIVWDNLDGRVLAVDVSSLSEPSWQEDALPAAASWDRQQLMEQFGARPDGLDSAGGSFSTGSDAFMVAVFVGVAALLFAAGVGAGVAGHVVVVRRRRPAAPSAWDGWSGSGGPGPTWPPHGSWPVAQDVTWTSGYQPAAPPSPQDPWRSPTA